MDQISGRRSSARGGREVLSKTTLGGVGDFVAALTSGVGGPTAEVIYAARPVPLAAPIRDSINGA